MKKYKHEVDERPKWMLEWVKKHGMLCGLLAIFMMAVIIVGGAFLLGRGTEAPYPQQGYLNKPASQKNYQKQGITITIKQFKEYVKNGKIISFTKQKNETIDSYILSGSLRGVKKINLVISVNKYNTNLEKFLEDYSDVTITPLKTIGRRMGGFSFFWILPFIIGFLIFRMIMSKRGGARGSDAQFNNMKEHSKAKTELIEPGDIDVSFKDVAGCNEAIEDMEEIVAFLKSPEKFNYLGGKMPKGVLLVGPPGCGKTLLAKAVAGETNVPFFSITGADFAEAFVGIGPARIRDMFAQAKKRAPCIIFIDELDSLGESRGSMSTHSEKKDTLNKLLAEMDGFKKDNPTIIVLAATNRPDQLDTALLRPGRFDRQVLVDKPDIVGREAILKIHARGVKIADENDLKAIAKRTPGLSGADLANVINEGALLAARNNKKQVKEEDLIAGISRALTGQEQKSKQISDREKRIIAYHEVGHAVASFYTNSNAVIHKITIIRSSKGMLGHTLMMPEEDLVLTSKQDLENMIIFGLGGRATEEVILKCTYTGAQNDLDRATEIARKYVSVFGMDPDIGLLSYGQKTSDYLGSTGARGDYSEKTAQLIDKKMKKLIDDCYKRAKEEIEKHKDEVNKLVEQLIEKETLETEEIAKILKR